MGACGCGDFNGAARIPGPDGKWWVLSVYYGCNYCDNPAGVFLDLMDDDHMQLWNAQHLPVLEGEHAGVPVIGGPQLTKAVFEALDKCGANCGEDEFVSREPLRRAAAMTDDWWRERISQRKH